MAFDHSSHRPSPQWSDMAAAAAGDKARVKKVKLLCSFGGRILPRPSDGTLRYVGGHTRIISVQKDATFPEFSAKMAETLNGPAVVFKYQLPGEDLDALISVSCAEDLANMLEEHDKLIEAAPDGSAKIRAFLFSPAELAAETDQSMRIGSVTDDADRVYFEVINGMASASGIGAIRRRDSNASFASSTQNSEGTTGGDAVDGGASEGMSSGLLSYSGDYPQDAAGLVHVDGDNAPTIMAADIGPPDKSTSSQNLNFRSREQTPLMSFAPSTYIEPVQFQYTNPQQLGVAGGPRTVNLVPFPMHHYMTGAPVNTLSSASEIDSSNQIQESLEFKLDMSHGGSNLQHLRNGNFMPLSQLPPLPPFYAQSPNIEGYGLNQMPFIPQSQTSSSNDCLMCQKALPHAHSDTLIQDHALGSVGHLHEVNPVFHSYRSRDSVKQPVPYLTTGKMTQNFLEQKTESSILADQLADYLLPQNNDVKENANIRSDVQKTANANHVDVVLQNANELSWENKALDGTSAPKLMQCHMDPFQLQQQQDHHQLTHIFQQQGNPVKQELLANPSGIMEWQTLQTSQIQQEAVIHPAGANAATNSHFAAGEAISQEHVNMPYYEYVRTVSDRVNMLDLDRMEASEFGETGVNTECISSSHYTNPAEISTANLDRSQLHNLEPFRANEAATIVAFSKLSLHNTRMGIEHPVPSSSYPEGYCGIVNGNINDGAYGASQSQSREMLGHSAALPSCDVSFQLSDVIGPTGAVETCHEAMTSNIHVGNQDIPSVPGGISSLPSRPNTMTDEYVAPKDSCIPNYVGVSDGSNIIAMLEEGSLQSLSERHINDFSYEPMQLIKEVSEDHNVQQLQGVDENVAVSIHQSNVTGSAFETEEFIYHFNNVKAIENNNDTEKTVTDEKDIKSKNLEMAQHGIQLADNVGNLQIIKNNDLEELRELGSGAFGTVYHGKWRGTDVAIKRINDRCFVGKKSEQERMRTDFWNEACKLADLHHPNVVAFYGIVLDGHQGCISTVTEYMINGSLRQVIQRNDRIFDRNKRLIIAMDVAFGMEYLHAKNIIHFDLKSDNVLVNFRDPQRPICKVGDLGLSKVKCKTLISGGMRGTLPWMAPELLCGNDSLVSEKVDIYSFGVVMWELLTSKEPYSDLHYGSIIGGILSNTLRPPIPESCELDWRMLMEQCWSSEPSERPSFTEITDRLRLMAAAPHLKAQGQAQK